MMPGRLAKMSVRLRQAKPLCEICDQPAEEAAHLISRVEMKRMYAFRSTIWFTLQNLASLCRECHVAFDVHIGVNAKYFRRNHPRTYELAIQRFRTYEAEFQWLLDRRKVLLRTHPSPPMKDGEVDAGLTMGTPVIGSHPDAGETLPRLVAACQPPLTSGYPWSTSRPHRGRNACRD